MTRNSSTNADSSKHDHLSLFESGQQLFAVGKAHSKTFSPILHGGGVFCPLPFFCVINPFKKRFLCQINLTLSQNSLQITLENFEVGQVARNFPIFEIFPRHFPKPEHSLAHT